MENYEHKIINALEGSASAVYYRVTPIYDSMGESVLPVGLRMEAVAVDASDQIIQTLFNLTLWNA
jgi:hypothetical protein